MDKEESLDIVQNAKDLLAQIESRRENISWHKGERKSELSTYSGKPPSKSTIENYKKEYERLKVGSNSFQDILNKAKDTTSIRTWYRRRAALLNRFSVGLLELIEQQSKLNLNVDKEQWSKQIRAISNTTDYLRKIENEPPPLKINLESVKSKKKDLKGLPNNWREEIIGRMPTYQAAILTLAITGCRPIEIVKGVTWRLVNDSIVAVINGAKISKHSGQETRILTFACNNPISNSLKELIVMSGTMKLEVKIESAINLTTAIRSAGKRAFPKRKKSITCYSFRHQVTADWKSISKQSHDIEDALIDVSKALGHASDATKRYYGHSEQAKSDGLMPIKVSATRKVKQRKKPDFSILAKEKSSKKLTN